MAREFGVEWRTAVPDAINFHTGIATGTPAGQESLGAGQHGCEDVALIVPGWRGVRRAGWYTRGDGLSWSVREFLTSPAGPGSEVND